MKKILAALLMIFISAQSFAALISIENIEITLPDSWKPQKSKQKKLLVLAGIASAKSDIFVMESQTSKTDDSQGQEDEKISIVFGDDSQYLSPVVNVYKVAAKGISAIDYKAAQAMTFRVLHGGRVLESKDNYIVVSYPDGMNNIRQMEHYFVKDDILYAVLFAAEEKKFDGYRFVFEQIIKSFKIK